MLLLSNHQGSLLPNEEAPPSCACRKQKVDSPSQHSLLRCYLYTSRCPYQQKARDVTSHRDYKWNLPIAEREEEHDSIYGPQPRRENVVKLVPCPVSRVPKLQLNQYDPPGRHQLRGQSHVPVTWCVHLSSAGCTGLNLCWPVDRTGLNAQRLDMVGRYVWTN